MIRVDRRNVFDIKNAGARTPMPTGIERYGNVLDEGALRSQPRWASEGSENHAWTEEYRISDLETLCAPEVRTNVERRGIELISVADLR